ncbi:MAG: mycothiol synthase [Egibacteraceae bacterium]
MVPPNRVESTPVRISASASLDERTLRDVRELVETTTEIEGHRPVGEHKYAHLAVGARGWVGILAHDDDGRLVGYAHTRWNQPGVRPRMAVEVVVHPALHGPAGDGFVEGGPGVAERLLTEARAVLGRAGGGLLYLWVHRVEDPRTTLAARMGFAVQRELAFMTRSLDERGEPAVLPDDVMVRPYREGSDDEAFLEVNNAAFADHPENGAWDRTTFAERRSLDWFDPDGLFIAWRGEQALAFHWTKWHAHHSDESPAHEPVGEVYVLAVHPSAQGLGLGRALLRVGIAHLHDRGCRQAILYVDCASTGAVGLYRSEGFDLAYREVCYEEDVAPQVDSTADLLRPAF